MAYNFLSLVNDLNKAMNEVELTSSNFAAASGWHNDAKNSVNNAIRTINQKGVNWPFNHTRTTLPLVVNQVRYDLEDAASSVVWDSFQVVGSEEFSNLTIPLFQIDYEDYLLKYSDMEYQPSLYSDTPEMVFRTRDLQFGIIPPPDEEYDLKYEYYSMPADLEDWDDVPTVPEVFRYVIREGALHDAFMFRGDIEAAALKYEKFKDGLDDMTRVYVSRYEYVYSTMIHRW